MIIRVDIEIADPDLMKFTGLAYDHGFKREDPCKSWSREEMKQAAKHAIQGMVKEKLK
jgi:hypothetical protein